MCMGKGDKNMHLKAPGSILNGGNSLLGIFL
jgi:hypothetical protein